VLRRVEELFQANQKAKSQVRRWTPLTDERHARCGALFSSRRVFSRMKNSDAKEHFSFVTFLFAKEHASYAAAHAPEKEK
jgi:hypothetical protein